MKYHHIIRIASFCFLCALFCCKPEQQSGSIYGTVTDEATGDCVANAGVELLPKGLKTVTGFDGTFEFSQIDPGDYNLYVTKTGYRDLKSSTITITSGETVKGDVQIEKLPLALRVVDSDGQDISSLDFGSEPDVTSRTFSIFNDSPQRLTWWIEENCNWIDEVKSMLTNNQSGEIEPGRQEPIMVTINRSLLGTGLKTYLLNISSDNGSKELMITAGEDVVLPVITTEQISDVNSSSVTFNGTIVDPGTPPYTEIGFVYAFSSGETPTIDNYLGRITALVTGQTFSASVSGLDPNEFYIVRAYAVNAIDLPAYGNDIIFSTSGVPTSLTTSLPSSIGTNSATLEGTITEVGVPCYMEKGFCYIKTGEGEPSISNNKIRVPGEGAGAYSIDVDDLEYQTFYDVKAYAIQNGLPIYGNKINFQTLWIPVEVNTDEATEIGPTNAKLKGNISKVGSPAYTERGFCYKRDGDPTISDNRIVYDYGPGIGNYDRTINGLDYHAHYYVRAYAIQNGSPVYGDKVSFTTVWKDVQVNTSAATGIESNEAVFNGFIGDVGVPSYTERGFCFDNNTNTPTINHNKVPANGYGVTGNYNKKVTGLADGTTYYVRAYAIQDGVPIYGDMVSFTTNRNPIIHTLDVTNLTPVYSGGFSYSWSVTFNGFVEEAGDPPYSERGFCYGTESNPTFKIPVSGNGTGTFSTNVSDLLYYKTYYVRAYVKTSSGKYIYGQTIQFSTFD